MDSEEKPCLPGFFINSGYPQIPLWYSKKYFKLMTSEKLQPDIYGLIEYMFQRRQWHPTPVLLPEKSHGRRSLVGCSPWGCKESETTERIHFHFSLSCIGEGNGSPLQCSCLENLRDCGAWWAAVSGVTQSRTRLKQLSSTNSNIVNKHHTFAF